MSRRSAAKCANRQNKEAYSKKFVLNRPISRLLWFEIYANLKFFGKLLHIDFSFVEGIKNEVKCMFKSRQRKGYFPIWELKNNMLKFFLIFIVK